MLELMQGGFIGLFFRLVGGLQENVFSQSWLC